MKTVKIIMIAALCLSMLLIPLSLLSQATYSAEDQTALQEQFFRLHIRANSDAEADQRLKLCVRDAVLDYITPYTQDFTSKQQAISFVQEHLEEIQKQAQKVIRNHGYDYAVQLRIDREYFDYREYDGFYLPAGEYDSLIIEIGSGEGQNWWCVLFPAVCLSGAAQEPEVNLEKVPETFRLAQTPAEDEIQFDFWIVRALQNLFS